MSNAIRYATAGAVIALLAFTITMAAVSRTLKNRYNWTNDSYSSVAPPISKEKVLGLLTQVKDSELDTNIVELGLIYNVSVEDQGRVNVRMTLTSASCPYSKSIIEDIKKALIAEPSVKEVYLQLVFDPPWSWERVNTQTRERIFNELIGLPEGEARK